MLLLLNKWQMMLVFKKFNTTFWVKWLLQTVWLLEPGHLEEDHPTTMFFCEWTNKIQNWNMQPLKPVLTNLTSQETALTFYELFIGLFAKKFENLLFSKNVVIG